MAVTQYCTQGDLEDRLSALGVDLRIDDSPSAAMEAALNFAASRINFYCLRQYTADVLLANDWIKDRAVDIGVWILCGRRGNTPPKSVQLVYDEAIKELDMIRTGANQVPDAPRRKQSIPVLSQPRVKLFPVPETVVERGRSTGKPEGYHQRDDPIEPPLGNY